jgi:alkylhydroperoxidase family enzyme
MLEYGVKLTSAPETVMEADVAALRAQGLEDGDVLDLNLTPSYFNFVNRIALGLNVDVSPEEVSGYRY